jgi:TPR repeat protein
MSSNFRIGWNAQKVGNYDEAVKYYELAVNEGHQGAKFHLNCMYFGQGMAPQIHRIVSWEEISLSEADIVELKECYLELIQDKIIQNNLGLLYAVYIKDEATAFMYYMMSATQGYHLAQCNVGLFFHRDKLLKQDYDAAYKWYLSSANQGYWVAQNRLAQLYYNGIGLKRNYSEALKWYTLSADQEYSIAEYNLGNFYSNPDTPFLNYQTALKYYTLSASHGDRDAQEKLEWFDKLKTLIGSKLQQYISLNRNEGCSYLFFSNFLAYLTKEINNLSWNDPLLRSYITEHLKLHFNLEQQIIDTWFDDFY